MLQCMHMRLRYFLSKVCWQMPDVCEQLLIQTFLADTKWAALQLTLSPKL